MNAVSSGTLRATAKGALGTLLWPFATQLVARRSIGGGQGLILMFHYIGRQLVPGVGEDLFLDGLQEPYRSEALQLIRDQIGTVSRFFPTSESYSGFMAACTKVALAACPRHRR